MNDKPRIHIHDAVILDADTETVEIATSGPVTSVIWFCFQLYITTSKLKGKGSPCSYKKMTSETDDIGQVSRNPNT